MDQDAIVLRKFLDAEAKRDLDSMAACLHDEFSLYVVGANELIQGKSSFLNVIEKVFKDLREWDLGVVRMIGANSCIAVEFRGSGRFFGEFEGNQYVNVPIKIQSACVFDFQDGLIKQCAEYFDSHAFRIQLLNSREFILPSMR